MPPSPDPTPTPPFSRDRGRRSIMLSSFFLFSCPPTPLGGVWGSVLFLLEKHSMPTLKRMSAIFRNGQVGTQLQAHSGAFMSGVDPPPYMSDLSWDLPCTSAALRGPRIP